MIHAVFDLTHCQGIGADADAILAAMRETADLLGATVRGELAEPFLPHGATCVLILAESHLTVSTWPEAGLAHIDVFTCRADLEPGAAIRPLLNLFDGHVTASCEVPRLAPDTAQQPA